jgi:beta-galactosidase
MNIKNTNLTIICCIIFAYNAFAQSANFNKIPTSPRATYDFNIGWKFTFGDTLGADKVNFNDANWSNISLPHTWNDVDTYREYISHGGGDKGQKLMGIGWYRKHFKLPLNAKGKKIFLQFDGMRQAGKFYVNEKYIGQLENGITAVGFDVTNYVQYDGVNNIIAVKVDNSPTYKEEATGVAFQWNSKDFNPNYGGLNRNASLIITNNVYQTLPLYNNLKTTGVYVYPTNIDIAKKKATINIEAEIINETNDYAAISLSAFVTDMDGNIKVSFEGNTSDLVAGQTEILTASGELNNANFWSTDNPNLYQVFSVLKIDGKVVDVVNTKTGFRKTEFKGGVGTGGVYINDKFVWLTGYAQRSSNSWAGFGGAYPDWMHYYTLKMLKESNSNYIRWMHVAPQKVDVEACDKLGIVQMCPAGDKEKLVTGRQWEQRSEVMKATMIAYRNNPSVLFWEAGNTIVTPEQMNEFVAMRKELDAYGGRVMGTRDNDQNEENKKLTPMSEYYGVMIGQAPQTDKISGDDIFRGYSISRRDKAPLIETEDCRDEAGRNIWDNFSPPHFGFKPKAGMIGNRPVDTWHWNSETFCLAAAARYNSYMLNRIDNNDATHSKWSGYASIYFTDENADGRQQGSYVCRVSGKIDAVRIPKSLYYVSRVMQNEKPDVHIIGHWNYPADTKKTMYVAATKCDKVELFVNGKSIGVATKTLQFVDDYINPEKPNLARDTIGTPTGYIYAFANVAFKEGKIKAVATKNGKIVAQHEVETAGKPTALKLTTYTNSNGLQANGSDAAFIDVEVVDAKGRRCPTEETKIDFTITGPAIWRGGLNAAKLNTTNNLYLDTECGINRVAIRSTHNPGAIAVTATANGFKSATVKIEAKKVDVKGGLLME